jgi:hypothetical protein
LDYRNDDSQARSNNQEKEKGELSLSVIVLDERWWTFRRWRCDSKKYFVRVRIHHKWYTKPIINDVPNLISELVRKLPYRHIKGIPKPTYDLNFLIKSNIIRVIMYLTIIYQN